MTIIVEFRSRRNEADAVRLRPAAATPRAHASGDPISAGAEIILMPLNWLKQLKRSGPRKPLKRRFALREFAPA